MSFCLFLLINFLTTAAIYALTVLSVSLLVHRRSQGTDATVPGSEALGRELAYSLTTITVFS